MLVGEDGKEVQLNKVEKFGAKCVKGPSELIRHMRNALSYGYPTLNKVPEHDGEIVLCGAGPSLEDFVADIQKHKEEGRLIVAIKGSHDFLIERGVMPHIAIAVDPQEKIAKLYQKPKRSVRYYMSTQCHPEVFKALVGQHVVTWNVYTKSVEQYWDKYYAKKGQRRPLFFVNGGSTSGLRALTIAWVMGYRKVHLYGFDSCLKIPPDAINENGDVIMEKLNDSLLKVGGVKVAKDVVKVEVDGRAFYCDPAMALQGNEFIQQLDKMQLQVKAYGNGMIPYIVHQAAMRGMDQCVMIDEDWDEPSPLRGSLPKHVE